MPRSEFTRRTVEGWTLRPVGQSDWEHVASGIRFYRDGFRGGWFSVDDEYRNVIASGTLAGCVKNVRRCIGRAFVRAFGVLGETR